MWEKRVGLALTPPPPIPTSQKIEWDRRPSFSPLSLLFMNSNSCCLNCKGGRRRKGYKGKKGRRRVLCERGNFSTREGFFPLCHFTFGRVVPQRQLLLLQGTRLNLRPDLKEENLVFFCSTRVFLISFVWESHKSLPRQKSNPISNPINGKTHRGREAGSQPIPLISLH